MCAACVHFISSFRPSPEKTHFSRVAPTSEELSVAAEERRKKNNNIIIIVLTKSGGTVTRHDDDEEGVYNIGRTKKKPPRR